MQGLCILFLTNAVEGAVAHIDFPVVLSSVDFHISTHMRERFTEVTTSSLSARVLEGDCEGGVSELEGRGYGGFI